LTVTYNVCVFGVHLKHTVLEYVGYCIIIMVYELLNIYTKL